MNFICEPALREYMLKKKRSTILVEEITSSHSDFEITELHIRLIDERQAAHFKSKKRYYTCKTDFGEVLLPPFKLKIQDTVTFSLKSFLGIKYVAQKGIVK
ncbi:MAG: hypothetical protein K2P13_05875 [Lachnospiraceae bacterium]|nr:hypothetical protein [Lachnospiraceae bacterium]MDE6976515.1 hypothetical protein [Lachnospiraceae bacterium]